MTLNFNMNNCTEVKFCPALPSDHVLNSGAVIFPGVFDQLGSPLVIFPTETQNKLQTDVTKEEVAEFVYYCLRLHNKSSSDCLVSVVADLREASLSITRRVAEILLLLELHKRSVHSFYVVQPKKRDVQKLLQKLLSPSKRSATTFTCVYLKEVFELCKYIDRSQLTANLGGYFVYSHESWVAFVQEMDSFVQMFVAVVRKLPMCIAALQDFSKLSIPTDYESLTLFCSSNQARLEQIRRGLGLDALLSRCERMLEKFRYPEREQCYQAIVGTVLFTQTALEMLHNYDRIKTAVEKVELLWRTAFSNCHLQLRMLQLQRDSHQVTNQMDCVLQTLQWNIAEISRDSSRAETLRSEFKVSVYTRAMMLIRHAETLTQAVTETPGLREKPDWTKELESQTESFRSVVELHHRNLNIICNFHHCYSQIQTWYEMAVCERFLQDLLWIACANKPSDALLSKKRCDVLSAISQFLRLHPPPKTNELMQLAHFADVVPDAHLEIAGKQLVRRCTGLQKLLNSPGSATFCDLQMALHWQYECLKGNEPADLHAKRNKFANKVPEGSSLFLECVNGNKSNLTRCAMAKDPPLVPLAKPPSLSSFDSGFDGAGSGHLETGRLQISNENVSSVSEHYAGGKTPRASIHIIPRVAADSLNLAITVKRSATLPKNPWLSLPVDDLENCYTVVISPSSTQQEATLKCECLTQNNDQETGASVYDQDQNADWSPIRNALSSTITDGEAEQTESAPTLLWDSYDLHDLSHHSSNGVSVCEWELKEQQELRAVEESLSRAAGILQEEESVLAQEEILNVLLKDDCQDRLWPPWNHELTQTSSSGLSEAAMIGFEDVPDSPLGFAPDCDLFQESQRVSQNRESPKPCLPLSDPEPGTSVPDRAGLLQELKDLQALDEKIREETLKIDQLRCRESENCLPPHRSLSQDRKKFLWDLEREKKEVEELERSLSMEMNSKLNEASRNPKIVTCSVMRKFDEVLVLSCRRSSKTEPQSDEVSNHPSNDAVQSECLIPEAPHSFTNESVNDREIVGSTTSSTFSVTPTVMQSVHESDCAHEKIQTSSASVLSDFPTVHGFEKLPTNSLEKHLEPEIIQDTPEIHTDQSKPFACTKSESMDADEEPKTETLKSEEASTPPFDPGGPKPLPRLLKLQPQMSEITEGALHATLPLSNPLEHQVEPSALPKPKKRSNHPVASTGHLEHNNNNNNLQSAGSEALLEKSQEPEPTDEAEDFCSNEAKPEMEKSLVSSAQSPLIKTFEKKEAEVCYEGAMMRSFYKSPTPVVLDTGSGLVKAGFSDQDLPTTIFPTAIGLPKYEEVMSGSADRSVYVGHDAQHMRGVLTLHYPMKNGLVCNWDQMEMVSHGLEIWQHAFDQLRISSEDHPVLLTESAMNTLENRQRSVQIMFESFNVPLTYSALQPVLALYTTGRTTGLVFDSGDGVSHSVPVYDGYSLPHAIQRFNLAGADVTLQLKRLLLEQGVCMRTSAETEIVREIKERCCCVALDYEVELGRGGGASTPADYTLPDGQVISLTTERFRASEILFKPELVGQDYYGMHESIFKSVLKSDIDLRADLVGNIVLSGGNTLLAGLPRRLHREISRLSPAYLGQKVKVISPEDRDFSVWRGGAILASMASFSSAWISQDEYEEFGPQIVFRKCF